MDKKYTEDGFEIKSYQQQMYKVWFGGSLFALISEDSLSNFGNKKKVEECGTRTIYYITQPVPSSIG